MLFHMVLLSMVALITTYFKESDWLLKNFHQSENGSNSYHGEQNRGYHVKEHQKLCQKQVSKVTLHFVWGQPSREQTVTCGLSLNNIGSRWCPSSGRDVKKGVNRGSLGSSEVHWHSRCHLVVSKSYLNIQKIRLSSTKAIDYEMNPESKTF